MSAPALTTGSVLTVIFAVSVFWHPLASVPVSVYVVVNNGAVTIGVTLLTPDVDAGFQLYVKAPLALSVVDCPSQMTWLDADAITFGSGLTVIRIVSEERHVPVPYV